jgi:sigma-B regulation protein RsbU (phosphoserine phosphatase)
MSNPSQSRSGETFLEIADSTGTNRRQEITSDRLVLGRSPDGDVCLPAEGVSRQHAELARDPSGRWWIRDLASRNGTRVNGRKVAESLVGPGDRIRVGPYMLRLTRAGDAVSTLVTMLGQVPVSSDEPGILSSLAEMPAPHVQAVHISRLIQFGRELSEIEDSAGRLHRLCELMIAGGFPATCAAAVRVEKGSGSPRPMMLLAPVYAGRSAAGSMPYLSGRVLSAVMLRKGPVMASNTGGRAMDIQMSMAVDTNVVAQAAIACPIGETEQAADILYVVLPPTSGTGEWLAIANLACEQYLQSESLWVQRAVAAEHAVLQSELEQARKVQSRLVPRDVVIEGMDCAVEFRPCRWVGGDYVDVIAAPNDRFILMLADVCGHGMQAALLASTLHAVTRVLVPAGAGPDSVMKHLNDYLCEALEPGMFVTAMCIELDARSGKCRSLSAGHPAPFVVAADGACRELKCGENLPLGVQSEESLLFAEDTLQVGQILALYTDGLFEVNQRDGTQLGRDGFAAEFAAICKQPPANSAAIAQRLMKSVTDLENGAMATDDQTLLVLKRVK